MADSRKGYSANEYIVTLGMCVCLGVAVVTGPITPWFLLLVFTIAGLATHLRVIRVREVRAHNRRELEGPNGQG